MLEAILDLKRVNYWRIVLAAFAIVLFWRGIWGLLDLVLFPRNLYLSYSVSVLAGLVILFVLRKMVVVRSEVVQGRLPKKRS